VNPPAILPAIPMARACVTNFGACPMLVAIPRGQPCYCQNPYGQVWGVSR
jgi:hypothetical protein